jgi:chromosome segregation ATPase
VKIQKLADLEEKIEQIIKQHNTIKRDKEKIESRLAYKNKESEEVRKQLEQMLKQKEVIRQKLDGIIEKIQTLTIR